MFLGLKQTPFRDPYLSLLPFLLCEIIMVLLILGVGLRVKAKF